MWIANGSGSTVSDARDVVIHAIDSGCFRWFIRDGGKVGVDHG